MEKYHVEGMTCAACQNHVEKAVKSVEGVDNVSVSLLTNMMEVDGTAKQEDIIKAVENAGYHAYQNGKKEEKVEDDLVDTETPKLFKRLVWSVIFLLVLMYFSMGHNMLGLPLPWFLNGNVMGLGITQLLLSSIILFINRNYFVSAFKAMSHKSTNMDVLVAMGSGISYIWSLVILYKMSYLISMGNDIISVYHNELYFESAAMIPSLITIGKTLESFSKGKTTDALKSLMKLSAKSANVEVNGVEQSVDIKDVKVGDIFVVKSGEEIPVDGVIIDGECSVDESALSGESLPVDKKINDKVNTATINLNGYIRAKATAVGEDTTLAKIIKLMSDASLSKAPIARIADIVASYFVPGVLIVALIVFVAWLISGASLSLSLTRAVTVLVISCPCALGLATPVAIMVGSGKGARNGILFKTSESLENVGKIDIMALDKTGTLTEGKMRVVEYQGNDDLFKYVYAIENNNNHPLAKAIVEYSKENNIELKDVSDYQDLIGKGASGIVDGHLVKIGNDKYINNSDVSVANVYRMQGLTSIFVSVDEEVIGVIGIGDEIKSDAIESINALKKMGITPVMITGDNEITAKAIGDKLGIERIYAQVLPEDKERIVRELQREGKVAMVGDGINDGPSLVRSDVGIAIGAGTDVAIDSADIVLMNSKLSDLCGMIRLSRKTLKNIYENLFWAFMYNALLIPMAAGLYKGINLNPMWGAGAMSLSSVTVVLNALRLNLVDIYNSKHDHKIRRHKKEEVKEMKEVVKIDGMMCSHCEANVKKALEAIDGIDEALVSHEKGEAEISLSKVVDDEVIKNAIEKKDYTFKEIIK